METEIEPETVATKKTTSKTASRKSSIIFFVATGAVILISLTTIVWFFLPLNKSLEQRTPTTATSPTSTNSPQESKKDLINLGNGISLEKIDSTYQTVSQKPSGFFQTGQEADILLSGINFYNTGGPLLFNHPANITTDGQRLLLADRNNSRVLIWNTLPTSNTPPNLVLGQKNFITNYTGTNRDQMNWPVGLATDGQHLMVTDTENDRILIWNSFPTENGQPADVILTNPSGEASPGDRGAISWPWAIWTNGQKMVVASTAGAQVLIWNNLPTKDNQPADLILQLPDFGTPRSVGSNGQNLVIGDHNAFGDQQGTFFWKSFPTVNNQPYDFFMVAPKRIEENRSNEPPETPNGEPQRGPEEVLWGPTFTPEGKFLALGVDLYIWDSFPQNEAVNPDLIVGRHSPGGIEYWFVGGDGSSLAVTGDQLYVSLNNGNKIVGFNSLPTHSSQNPDFAIGSPDIDTNTLETNFFITNPVPATDGQSLFVSSDFDSKLYVWKNLPNESGAKPDFIYHNLPSAWDNALFDKTLILAGQQGVVIWKKLPKNGEPPDLVLKNSIGSVQFQDIKGVALDDRYFYLADHGANKVYVWEGVPDQTSEPKFSFAVNGPWRLSSNGQYLAVDSIFNQTIQIYSVDNLSSTTQSSNVGGVGLLNLPEAALVSHGHLFVADTGFNRVFVWEKIEDALAGYEADVILGAIDLNETTPEIAKDKVFWPAGLAFDGSFLWLGEFKFSGRILRFSVR